MTLRVNREKFFEAMHGHLKSIPTDVQQAFQDLRTGKTIELLDNLRNLSRVKEDSHMFDETPVRRLEDEEE